MNRLLLTAVCLLGVSPVAAQRTAPAPLTRADEERIVPVHVGQVLTVDLRQSAGTGSGWRMVPATGLVAVGVPVVLSPQRDGPPIVGGPEIHRFRVRVTMGGELALTFVNARTFGGLDQRAETATFIIEAK